ncbi:hypothetical protein AXF15_03600 [Desulfomicrobium orale DSM 12838]|uniref:Uncharacterized protein n=1 Tax=Desulfomicrobium orale DSM 12838 TaxID=888061 RepID=A0A109W5L1_9BACT|nr:hypothetical protein AXF15_03600 [Desulfomicrobium orale DSM 12838]
MNIPAAGHPHRSPLGAGLPVDYRKRTGKVKNKRLSPRPARPDKAAPESGEQNTKTPAPSFPARIILVVRAKPLC